MSTLEESLVANFGSTSEKVKADYLNNKVNGEFSNYGKSL
jgi:hypothetical protein